MKKMHSPKQRSDISSPRAPGTMLARHATLWNDPNVWQQLRPSLCKEKVAQAWQGSLSVFQQGSPMENGLKLTAKERLFLPNEGKRWHFAGYGGLFQVLCSV